VVDARHLSSYRGIGMMLMLPLLSVMMRVRLSVQVRLPKLSRIHRSPWFWVTEPDFAPDCELELVEELDELPPKVTLGGA